MAGEERKSQLQTDRAVSLIRERILDCVFPPGSYVSERGLAAQLDLGLAPVRAALSRLVSEGLVIPAPRVGYQVAPIALRDISAFFEAWLILGPELLQLAVQRMTDEQRRRLENLTSPESPSPEALVRHIEAQWQILAEAVDNDVLADLNGRIQRDLRRLLIIAYRRSKDSAPPLLLPRVLDGTPEEARAVAVEYISAFRERINRWIAEDAFNADISVTFR